MRRLLLFACLAGCTSFTKFRQASDDVDLTPVECRNGVQDNGEAGVDCGGACAACDASMMMNEVPDPPCVAESDAALCLAAGDECGSLSTTDRCGAARTLDCGSCALGIETCDAGQCVCAGETDAELCAAIGHTCNSASVVDRCGANRVAQCGTCADGRTCTVAGVCTSCPASMRFGNNLQMDRIFFKGGGTPALSRIDNRRGIIQGANADLSTVIITFDQDPYDTSTAAACIAANMYVGDLDSSGGYVFNTLDTSGFFTAEGESFAISADGMTFIAPNTARDRIIKRTRSSARGQPVVLGTAADVSPIVTSQAQLPAMSPDGSMLFWYEGTGTPHVFVTEGTFTTARDMTAELTYSGQLFYVQSVSNDTLSLVANNGTLGARMFSRLNKSSAYSVVGEPPLNGFRTRINGSCTRAITTCEGGCENERVCFVDINGYTPEDDSQFCANNDAECDTQQIATNGQARTVNCGTCDVNEVCTRGGRCLAGCPGTVAITYDIVTTTTPTFTFLDTSGAPVSARTFIAGMTFDGSTMLVTRGCGNDVYFADRISGHTFQLVPIATATQLTDLGLMAQEQTYGLSLDGLSALFASTAGPLFEIRRPGKAASFSLAPRPHRSNSVSSASSRVASPVFSEDDQFMAYTLVDATGAVLGTRLSQAYARGIYRDIADISADVPMRPTAIGSQGLSLYATDGAQTCMFVRSDYAGNFVRMDDSCIANTIGARTISACLGDVLYATETTGTCANDTLVVRQVKVFE